MDRPAPTPAFALLLTAAVVILAVAFAFQYLGGLHPCELCLWQRYPYAALIGIAGVGLGLARVPGVPRGLLAGLAALAALAMASDAGIAVFHVGVEHHWWVGLASCSGDTGTARTVEELARQLQGTAVVRCDAITWSFAGITMAGYNALAAVVLALFAGWTAYGLARPAP